MKRRCFCGRQVMSGQTRTIEHCIEIPWWNAGWCKCSCKSVSILSVDPLWLVAIFWNISVLHSCISNTVNGFKIERNAAQHHMSGALKWKWACDCASQRWEGTYTAVPPQKFLVILQRSVLHSKMCFWLDSAPLQITMQSVTNLGAERLLEQLPCICLPLGWHSSSGLTSAWQLGANQACCDFP